MRVTHLTTEAGFDRIRKTLALKGHPPDPKWGPIGRLFDGPSTCVWVAPLPFAALAPIIPFRWATGCWGRRHFVEFDLELRELPPAGLKSLFWLAGFCRWVLHITVGLVLGCGPVDSIELASQPHWWQGYRARLCPN